MDKYVAPDPLRNQRALEVLLVLIEECAEVSHRASKMMRFGVYEAQAGQSETNKDRLSVEVGDLLAMLDLCTEHGLLDWKLIEQARAKKPIAFEKYSQTEPE